MADIKKLFEKQKGQQVLADATLNKVGAGIESADYVKVNVEEKKRFVPYINFSSASNFARYGLAEKYYEDSIDYITNEYPYDGSKREKINWHLTSSYLDRYIFENEYPRTNGYINFGLEYGATSPGAGNFDATSKQEYVQFFGNNTTTGANITPNQRLALNFKNLRLYDTASQGISNLEIDGNTGLGVEFWFKKNGWQAAESENEVFVDVWNSSSVNPGRFLVYMVSGTGNYQVEIESGSAQATFTLGDGLLDPYFGGTSNNTWHHWALMFKNLADGSGIQGKLYHNGNLIDTEVDPDIIGKVTGSVVGNIGATTYYGYGATRGEGFGKLSGSLDEFRFWKRERSAEQVGRNWFTQVGGGTNTDITNAITASTKYSYENPVDLGVYYKFNEGIFNTSSIASQDAVVLDYAGRVTNGSWTGYSVGARSTKSAIVESSASLSEFKDPIVYSTNPSVVSLRNTKKEEGQLHDFQNNANIYHSIPSWILAEDEDRDREPLKDLTQIMASYFDTLHLQIKSLPEIKNVRYPTGSDKPYPFADRLINSLGLVTSDIFSNATDLEYLASRNDHKKFAEKLNETKNRIYQNIYNNLIYIYKSKGTEKSFRNLIRCFGVGQELININLYGDDITHELRNNLDFRTIKKKYANFHSSLNFNSTVFQATASENTNSRAYISSNSASSWGGNTYEAEAIFATQLDIGNVNYIPNDFIPASIFGCHTSGKLLAGSGSTGGDWTSHVLAGTTITYDDSFGPGTLTKHGVNSNDDCSAYATGSGVGVTIPGYAMFEFGVVDHHGMNDTYFSLHNDPAAQINPNNAPEPQPYSIRWGHRVIWVREGGFVEYTDESRRHGASENYPPQPMFRIVVEGDQIIYKRRWNYTSGSALGGWEEFYRSTTPAIAGQTYYPDVNIVQNSRSISQMRWYSGSNANMTVWPTSDEGNFQVQSVRSSLYSKDAFFRLTGTLGYQFSELTSSLFKDVYDGSKWNFAVRIKPSKYPLAPSVSGSNDSTVADTFDLNFSGYNYVLDKLVNSFTVTSSVARTNALNFLTSQKRFFVGAHRQDFDSVVLQKSDAKISSLRVWQNYLDDETLMAHAQDAENFGTKYPYKSAYISQNNSFLAQDQIIVPQMETLVLNWNFDTVTSSNTSGEFMVPDVSSGSVGQYQRWGWLGEINEWQYPGLGFDFPENDTEAVSREYIYSAKQQLPEVLNSSDMISLIDEDTNQIFSKDSRPIDYSIAFEKSMNSIISEQIINYFGTIIAFNNLIGEPVNRYRQEYKDLEKLRGLYFERVQNTPDFEKFVEFFKWIDDAVGLMLIQLAPASARVSEKLRNVIESHVLERNKYWNKFPTLEMKLNDPEAGLHGINELLYSAKRGIAPIPTTVTASNCEWWYDRTERDNPNITSGDSTVDFQRNTFRLAHTFRSGSGPTVSVSRASTSSTTTYEAGAYAVRNFTKPYRLGLKEMQELYGGSNTARIKNEQYAHTELPFGSSTQLKVLSSEVESDIDCNDVVDPNDKVKLRYKLTNNPISYKSGKGDIFAPWSLYSSSVQSGYATELATDFRANTDITNYHNDAYGDDKEVPMQGPFTEKYVGGREYRHVPYLTPSGSRPEAWNLDLDDPLAITARTVHQPRSTILREPLAKRPINIRNIRMTTGSTVIGNYSHKYEVIQTSGRRLNNRFFVKNEGFNPPVSASAWIDGLVDYPLPRYDLIGKNQFIFVERFNAPGGPEVSSRGSMDINAEEYSVYNELNQRNSIVRNALNKWQTDHCGPFGIDYVQNKSSSIANLIYGPGEPEGYRQTRWQNYNTLASYHKTNRNAGRPYSWEKDFSREIEWIEHTGTYLSNYDRTLHGGGVAGPTNLFWPQAKSNQPLETTGFFEFEISDIDYDWFAGIDSDETIFTNGGPWYNYSFWFTTASLEPRIKILERFFDTTIAGSPEFLVAVGDKLRIFKNKSEIIYQHLSTGSSDWKNVWTSTTSAAGNYYPRAGFRDIDASSITNPRISNPQYDNWFIQHDIPQSDLQYAWINNSYDQNKNQPFGYTSRFSVPFGSISTTASAVQFVSASTWDFPIFTNGRGSLVNFVNVFSPIPTNLYANLIKYTLTSSTNTITPGQGYLEPLILPYCINTHFNNINGPYGYPSWKQIRTGETPVARYQKRNNILSVMSPPRLIELANGNGPGTASVFFNSKMDTYKQFIEPPVVFKYKALNTIIGQQNGVPLKLRHSYGNNKCMFSQAPVRNVAEYGNSAYWNSVTANSRSVEEYLNIPKNTNPEIYDVMRGDPDVYGNMVSNLYSEVIYPRGTNTGLAKTRGRTQYAEIADGTLNSNGTFSASLSDGINGIDRGPLERRTFWRDQAIYRNRRSGFSAGTDQGPSLQEGWNPITGSYIITGTLPNSQGYIDGFATSIYGLGTTPIAWSSRTYYWCDGDNYCSMSNHPDMGGIFMGGNWSGIPGAKTQALIPTPDAFPDTGELNSANYQTIAGYAGSANSSSVPSMLPAYQCSHYPTASAYYYHITNFRGWGYCVSTQPSVDFCTDINFWGDTWQMTLPWRVSELSGKNPWFDSYEDYANDIRGLAKSFTIIPEFRISEHMEYYGAKKFLKQNDKFLSLDGAAITSSADTEKFHPVPGNELREFNSNFFKEYSNTDFQKYFGKFNQGSPLRNITLKCNGVKKLLPYYGFYPVHRTLQLASMFSQSLGPHISGISWSAGLPMEAASEYSGALAVQSMLQPYYAPGIMYNTLKSGMAVSWGAITGSSLTQSVQGQTTLTTAPNYVIPFESILDPLANIGIPESNSSGTGKLHLLYPTFQSSSTNVYWQNPSSSMFPGQARTPYVNFGTNKKTDAASSPKYRLYQAAINNFFAEIPNFFLKNNKLTLIGGYDSIEEKLVKMTPGDAYYMDIYLGKNEAITMSQEPSSDISPYGVNLNGKLFGPPFRWTDGGFGGTLSAPAYAPNTPPYFYGTSKVRIKYEAIAGDNTGDFKYQTLFKSASLEFINDERDELFAAATFDEMTSDTQAAKIGAMQITSSLNIFGLFSPKKVEYNAVSGRAETITDNTENQSNHWVISPKMETPVLNFSDQPFAWYPPSELGASAISPIGMWSGYGKIPSDLEGGITYGLQDSQFSETGFQPMMGAGSPATSSLLDACFRGTQNLQQTIGEIGQQKVISEAIVAIPFMDQAVSTARFRAYTTPIIGKHFFAIEPTKFDFYRDWYLTNKFSEVQLPPEPASVSIQKMITLMDKYVIPPELDFLTFNKYGNVNNYIKPYVMYLFEFNHTLADQELADIWQGVMPEISRVAELSNPAPNGVDDNVFSHPTGVNEFFHGKIVDKNIRWMVFKVKRKANWDYKKITAQTEEDEKFDFKFNIGDVEMPYSYNWPYDYFSLVELAQIETANQFEPSRTPTTQAQPYEAVQASVVASLASEDEE